MVFDNAREDCHSFPEQRKAQVLKNLISLIKHKGITRRVIPSFYFSGEFSEPSCPGLADAEHPQLTIGEEAKPLSSGYQSLQPEPHPYHLLPFSPGSIRFPGNLRNQPPFSRTNVHIMRIFSLEKLSKLCYYTYQICTSRKEEDHETDPQLFRLYKPKAPPSRPAVDRWLFSLRCWLFGDFFSYPACCHHGAKLRYRGASAR